MKDLRQFMNHSDKEIQEQELKGAINKILDRDLKNDITASLASEYGIVKKTNVTPIKSGNQNTKLFTLKRIITVAATFLILFSAYFYLTSTKDAMSLANQYAYAEMVTHPGLIKGVNDPDEIRKEAIQLFNNQKWSAAAEKFGAVSVATPESVYYHGMSLFYSKDFPEAITIFQNELLVNSVFVQEVKWYLGLSYLLNGQNVQGKDVLKSIKIGEWNYEKSRKLLK